MLSQSQSLYIIQTPIANTMLRMSKAAEKKQRP